MSNNTISENLRHLLSLHGNLSTSELSRQTNIPQPTLHHLLSGSTKRPRRALLEALANFFSISVPQLTGALPLPQTIPDSLKKNLNITTLPIINWDIVGYWPQVTPLDTKEIIIEGQLSHGSFALMVDGSMKEALFPAGSILIFDSSKALNDRQFIVVQLNDTREILFNRLFIEESECFIKQTQSEENMQLIKITPGVDKILGTLVEVRLQF